MSVASLSDRTSIFDKIPPDLRVTIIQDEPDFVVISKPCNLRSVPGHLHRPSTANSEVEAGDLDLPNRRRRKWDQVGIEETPNGNFTGSTNDVTRRTAQEAWVVALQSFANDKDISTALQLRSSWSNENPVESCLVRLAASAKDSIPRRYKHFVKYLHRNQKRLFPEEYRSSHIIGHDSRDIIDIHRRLQTRMREIMNQPEMTAPEESAFGQLKILCGNDDSRAYPEIELRVVHRLDCEVCINLYCGYC
jgi:hypothetical protein